MCADDGILGQINQLVPLAVLPLPINSLVYTLDGVLVGASDFGWVPAQCCCCRCNCCTVSIPRRTACAVCVLLWLFVAISARVAGSYFGLKVCAYPVCAYSHAPVLLPLPPSPLLLLLLLVLSVLLL